MGREGCRPAHQVALAQGQAGAVNSGTGLSGGKHLRLSEDQSPDREGRHPDLRRFLKATGRSLRPVAVAGLPNRCQGFWPWFKLAAACLKLRAA